GDSGHMRQHCPNSTRKTPNTLPLCERIVTPSAGHLTGRGIMVLAYGIMSVTNWAPPCKMRDTGKHAVHRIFNTPPRSSTLECRAAGGRYRLYRGRHLCGEPE